MHKTLFLLMVAWTVWPTAETPMIQQTDRILAWPTDFCEDSDTVRKPVRNSAMLDAPDINTGELLYNGIQLPARWPPDDRDPFSSEPMPVPYLENPPKTIRIDIGRQLFVDDFLIERTDLVRQFHQAKKYEGNPVILNGALRHGGVFYDPLEKHFTMLYNDGDYNNEGEDADLTIAHSQDLRHWTPSGDHPGTNHKGTASIPEGGASSFWMRVDGPLLRHFFIMRRANRIHPRPKDDPNVPYINATWQYTLNTSRDGTTWSEPVALGRSNDYSSFFYNPFRDVWVLSLKHNVPRVGRQVFRTRYYLERKSISQADSFDDAVFWITADKLDEPHPEVGDATQLYSLQAVAYESLLLGAFQVHLGPKNEICEERKEPKFTEIKLGFSRDGFHWHRPDRTAFIKGTYQDGDWDKAFVNSTHGVCLVIGDELWFPYCAYSGVDADGSRGMYKGAAIGMATLRRDGFASMEAGATEGTLLTRTVVFNGKHMFVNVDCPDGQLRVEILDERDRVVKRFAANTCKPIRADKTLHKVEWEKGDDLSPLAGKRVKFRFYLTNGKLYSFWVSAHENGASRGFLGAGGPGYGEEIDKEGIEAYQNR